MTFAEAIAAAKACEPEKKPTVLLGNGFSRSYLDESFNYKSLWARARVSLTTEKTELERVMGSSDFEAIIRRLDRTAELVELYDPASPLTGSIRKDSAGIRAALCTAIAELHPDHARKLNTNQRTHVRTFLEHFEEIFTTNYDLLVYWATNDDDERKVVRDDGFRGSKENGYRWRKPDAQRVHYLHGAIHVFEQGDQLTKAFGPGNTHIMSDIRRRIEAEEFPLIVTEGASRTKRERIAESRYLTHCFDRLGEASGALFTFGSSLDANDAHLFDQLTSPKSTVHSLYAGLRPDSSSSAALRDRAHGLAGERDRLGGAQLSVHFYDAGSAAVWS
ncbi:DUF4917 family protein [Leucobacter chromiireducens]|uniref:DUF4917 family protein n=1 Tax=Leucobacter chromiireducens TaxID=283877 RepID=UPI0013DDF2AD|nr:DUF4917 family protein [Leucobacter chromiireducens]